MIKFYKKKLFFFSALLLLPFTGYCTHIVGGSLTYVYNGGNNYTVTLKLYKDCSGGAAPFDATANIDVQQANGSEFSPSRDFTLATVSTVSVSPSLPQCATAPASMPCVQERTYRAVVNLPAAPGGMHLYYQVCCRNGSISNIANPSTVGESYYAFIPCYNSAWSEDFTLPNGTTNDAGPTAWTRTLGCTPPASAQVNNGQFEIVGANSANTWLEDFTLADGTTSEAGTTAWTRTVSAGVTAQVTSNIFEITGVPNGSMTWASQVIDISSCLSGFNLSAALSEASTLEAGDNITISYSLDGGVPVVFPTNGSISNDFTSATATANNLSGSTVQIFVTVQFDGTDAGEIYRIDNITVSANAAMTWASQVINIAGYASGVNLSMNLSESSALDANDNITVSYSLNGGSPIVFSTNGSISNNFGSAYATATGIVGNTVQIFVAVKYDAASAGETYDFDMPTVYDNTFIANSSPAYNTVPPLLFCQTYQDTIDYSATDPDGDVLIYSLYTPYENASPCCAPYSPPAFVNNSAIFSPITWLAGYSAASPINLGGPALTINSATGEISGIANTNGRFVLGVKCQEYRNGVLLGEITRGYQVTTVVCPPFVPTAPTPGTGNSSPICEGQTLSLTASTVTGAISYQWSGPNGFTSSLQNPTIPNVTTAASGTYSVYASVTGCNSAVGTISVTVNPAPASPTAGSNSTVCEGQTLSLTSNTIANTTYNWAGPNSFSSTLQNPSIFNVTTAASGTYTVTRSSAIGCVSTAATTAVAVNPTPSAPVAGSNSAICEGQTLSLTANGTGITYLWTGPNSFSSAIQNPAIAAVTTAASGNYSVTTTALGCTSAVGTTSVTVNPNPAAPITGSNSPVCAGATLSLAANTISGAAYSWTGPNSFSSALQNPSITTVTTAAAGSYSISVTINGCTGAAGTTSVVINTTPLAPSTASNSPVCTGQNLTLAASTISGAAYSWIGPNGFSSTLQNPSVGAATTASAGNYSVSATVSGCTGPSGVELVIVNETPTTPSVSSNSPVCSGQTLSLTSATIPSATYIWSGPSSFSSTLQNPSIPGVTTANAGSYSVTAMVSGCGSAAATTSVTVLLPPAVANAGPDQTTALCGLTSTTLAANTPAIGTGSWSIISGTGGSFGNALSPSSSFNGTAGATYVLRWTITNSSCTSSTDYVTISFDLLPTTSNAGPDQTTTLCGLTSSTLAANTPAIGTGSWSIVSGTGGSFGNALSPTSTFNGTANTTYVLRWTITNASCTSADNVTIIFNVGPTIANAGPDQTIALCGLTSTTLAANTPVVGTGSWSIVSGTGGSVGNASMPTSTFSGTAGTTYVLRWTIINAPCTPSADDVIITFGIPPTVANAGPDQSDASTCGLTSVTLAANAAIVGTGSWSIVSGAGGSFGNALSPASTFSGTVGTTYILRWTITSAPCTSNDDVTVTLGQFPTIANAGPDQPICSSSTTLAGNTPIIGTGVWTKISGSGVLTTPTSPTSGITGLTPGNSTYRWTITSGACTSFDEVDIINGSVPAINAGTDQTLCNATTGTLAGNIPVSGTGAWSVLSGGGTVDVPSTANSTVSSLAIGDNTFRWTITDGGCIASDDITIAVNAPPTISAAGADQTDASTCGITSVTLAANSTTVGTGSWSIVSGTGGSFGNITSPTSTFSGMAGSTYILRWTIANTPCTSSADDVTITFNQNPTTANAGPDQIGISLCGQTSTILAANTPTIGTGNWSIVSGAGGSFGNALSPASTFSGTAGNTYILRWAISNAPCTPSADEVTITFGQIPATPIAGSNNSICSGQTISLTASTIGSSTYSWAGPLGFSSALQNPTIYPATTANIGNYSVTATENGCASPVGITSVTVNPTPSVNASGNNPVCQGSTISLTATSITGTSYSWSGPNSFTSNLQNPTIIGAMPANSGTYTVNTTSSNGCTSPNNVYTVSVTPTIIVDAGADQTVCANNNLVSITGTSTTASVQWSTATGGVFANSNLLATTYTPSPTDVSNGGMVLTITSVNNGGCLPVTDQMTVTITSSPTANAGLNQTVCANNAVVTLNGSFTIATGGSWSTNDGTGIFSVASNMNATYTPSTADTAAGSVHIILRTTGNGQCNAVTDTMLVVFSNAPHANAGANISVCINNPNASLNGSASTGSGTWATLGTGTFSPTNTVLNATYNPSAADIAAGKVVLVLASTNNGLCNAEDDSVTVFFTPEPTVNAGSNATVCANNNVVTLNGTSSTGSGTWTTSGTGTFTPNASTLTASYIPSSADTATGSVTLALTTNNNGGCLPMADQMTVTITNAPTANAGSNQTVCANNADITLNGAFTGTSGAVWTSSGTGTFANSTNMNSIYTPSVADITAGTVTITLTTTGNGLCNAVTDVMILTISGKPIVNAGLNSNACKNNPDYTLNGISSTGSGTWTTMGTGTFTPTATTLNATYIPSTADTLSGSVILILTSSNNANCLSEDDSITITYLEKPIINAGADQTVCSNNALVTLNGSSNTSSGQWYTIGTGTFVNSNSLSTGYKPGIADISTGSVKLVLTSANNGTCNPITDTLVVFFSTSPTVNAGLDQTVCANNALLTLNGAYTISSGAGWTTSGSGIFSPDTSAMNASYTPSAADTATGSVTLALTTTGNGTCLSVTDNMTVTITNAPKANAGADQTVCLSNSLATLNGTSSTGNGTWSTMGTGTFTSTSALSTTYSPSNADTATRNVKLILTTTGNGLCNAVTDTLLLTFSRTPVVSAGADQTICANADTVFLTGTSSTGSGIWSSGGTGIFSPSATSLNPVYFGSNADTATGSVVITFTSTNGCSTVSDNMTVTITPAPVVNAGADQLICAGTHTVALNGSVWSGASTGIWSTGGTGIFTSVNTNLINTYNISTVDSTIGSVTLYLTSANNGNCHAVKDSMQISVLRSPVTNAGSNQTICSSPAFQLNGTIIGGSGTGYWSTVGGKGVFVPDSTTLNAYYHPSASDTAFGGIMTMVLTSTNNGSCPPSRDTVVITLLPAPHANAWNDITACKNNADSLKLKGIVTNASGGQWSILHGSGSFAPTDTSLNGYYIPDSTAFTKDTITILLSTIGNGNCPAATDTLLVLFTPSPKINAGVDIDLCMGDVSVPLAGSVTGGSTTGHWKTLGSGTFTPNANALHATYLLSNADTAAKTITLILASTNNGNCDSVFDTLKVRILDIPVVFAGSNQTICGNNASITLDGKVISSAGTGVWTSDGTGKFMPDSAALNATYVPSAEDTAAGQIVLTLTATNECKPVAESMTVTITNAPVANAGMDVSICNGSMVSLNGSVHSATGGKWISSGNGIFTPDAAALHATYIPGSNDTGIVTLTLITTGVGQCIAVKDSITISIGKKPRAAFTNGPICLGTPTTFTDNSSITGTGDSIVAWNWIINKTINAMKNPVYIYPSSGKDSVVLIVTTAHGCSDTVTHIVNVNPSPVTSFNVLTTCTLDSVYFTNTSSIFGGNITSWNWNFGDSTSSILKNPVHYYNSAESFIVSLTAVSDSGCTTTYSNTIVPSRGVIAQFTRVADCSLNVQFNDASHTSAGDSVISWSWDFGDGSTPNTEKNPLHTYANTGTYMITLNIVTNGGCSNSYENSITLLPVPVADFSPKSGSYHAGSTISFTDLSINSKSWIWNFGDGSTDTIKNPSHTFSKNGILNVILIVANTNGCPDTAQYSFDFNTSAVVIPSAFTPNNDGVNDLLYVRGGPLKEMDWRIYNEWGNEIFHTTSQSEGWDGKYKGKKQPEARYIFILRGTTTINESVDLKGAVTILR